MNSLCTISLKAKCSEYNFKAESSEGNSLFNQISGRTHCNEVKLQIPIIPIYRLHQTTGYTIFIILSRRRRLRSRRYDNNRCRNKFSELLLTHNLLSMSKIKCFYNFFFQFGGGASLPPPTIYTPLVYKTDTTHVGYDGVLFNFRAVENILFYQSLRLRSVPRSRIFVY